MLQFITKSNHSIQLGIGRSKRREIKARKMRKRFENRSKRRESCILNLAPPKNQSVKKRKRRKNRKKRGSTSS